jgi:segregation and condensation protein B
MAMSDRHAPDTEEPSDPPQASEAGSAPSPAPADEDPRQAADPKSPDDQTGSVDAETLAVVEATLFATDRPISAAKIAQVAELPGRRVVKDAIESLNEVYAAGGRTFRIESIAGGYQMLTVEQYHDVVSRLVKVKSDSRLSKAALETLSIIAYRQPILRADVESIRGVASGEMIRKLMEKNLVKITGRAEIIGRPMLYGTTQAFLEVFGLSDLADLPHIEELRLASPAPPEEDNPPDEHDQPEPEGDLRSAEDSHAKAENSSPAAEDGHAEAEPVNSSPSGADSHDEPGCSSR